MKNPDTAVKSSTITSASLRRRLAAILYDLVLIIAFAIVSAFAWKLLLSAVSLQDQESLLNLGYLFIWFLSLYGFYQFFWLRGGQTLGMMAWRLQLRRVDGKKLGIADTSVRWLIAIVAGACCGLGYLWSIVDKEKRTWQDIVSKTRIIQLPKTD